MLGEQFEGLVVELVVGFDYLGQVLNYVVDIVALVVVQVVEDFDGFGELRPLDELVGPVHLIPVWHIANLVNVFLINKLQGNEGGL